MLTLSLSSKRCLTASLVLGCCLVAAPGSQAAISQPQTAIATALKRDLKARRTASFEEMLAQWNKRYRTAAVEPLLALASQRSLEDTDRYIAIMGAAKLGGLPTAPRLVPLLKDRSWMIRNATLRAITALDARSSAPAILPLLNDPALVVRVEAVSAIEKLRPAGSENALIGALYDTRNYHRGKAQWVPQRALRALVALKAGSYAPRLLPLLDRKTDPSLQPLVIKTLQDLTGKPLKTPTEWKRRLASSS